MESKNSAVLNVVSEHKEISSILIQDNSKDLDHSSICSESTFDNENSLVQSPSIESFSSIHDIENLSELNMDENSDLCVKVDNPEKHLETMETYITFRVTTRVARIEFLDHEYIARRRYNDFLWLRQKLQECHPFCIVPPLPVKHSLIGQLDRYSKDFILSRMKSLNTFISRICQHPILSCNENFQMFLTASPPDFATYRKKRGSLSSNSNSSIATLSHPSSTLSLLKNRHIEFDKMKSYLTILTDKLSAIEKISNRINKERSDLISEISSFHPIFTKWAGFDPQLCTTLENIGNALDRSSAAQSALVHSYNNSMGVPIKEFLQYIEVVQESLRKRESYQYAYESSLEELNKRHSEKDKLLAISQDPSQPTGGFTLWKQPSCDDKLEKLGTHIPQLLKKVESSQDNLEMANESLRSDLECWQQEKRLWIKKILLDFVNKQINYYQASVNAWEHVTGEMISENTSRKGHSGSGTK